MCTNLSQRQYLINLVFIFLKKCGIINAGFTLVRGGLIMKILRSIGEAFGNAIDYVSEKKRKFDKTTRIKKCIRQETSEMVKNYIKLGKYYYAELRNVPNNDMQRICSAIDDSKCEIKRLKCKLDEIDNGCDIKCYCSSIDSIDDDDDVCSVNYCSACGAPCGSYSSDVSSCCTCEPVCDCSSSEKCSSDSCFSEDDCHRSNCGGEGNSCCSEYNGVEQEKGDI